MSLPFVLHLQSPNDGASLVDQLVKNPSAMQEIAEMWVQSVDLEDPLEEEMATCFSILA